MAISDTVKYHAGAGNGKPATWTCGTAKMKAPVLKRIVDTITEMGEALSIDLRVNLFNKMMSKDTDGDAFVEALLAEGFDVVAVIQYVAAHKPTKGRAAAPGSGKSGKILKGFAKALALKFPATMEKQAIFLKLLDFLEKTENQEAIYREFERLATENGHDEATGMINLRKMTPESRNALVERGKKLGEGRAESKTVPLGKR